MFLQLLTTTVSLPSHNIYTYINLYLFKKSFVQMLLLKIKYISYKNYYSSAQIIQLKLREFKIQLIDKYSLLI